MKLGAFVAALVLLVADGAQVVSDLVQPMMG